jgi:glycosyltransferase involved in cell wall biosynthesis
MVFPGEEDFGIVPAEALACGAPVVALGRGGAAETVDDSVGRLYLDPSPEGLLGAIDAWEAAGRPHDAALARRRAEALAAPLFRDRLLGFLAEVAAGRVPPPPHFPVEAD